MSKQATSAVAQKPKKQSLAESLKGALLSNSESHKAAISGADLEGIDNRIARPIQVDLIDPSPFQARLEFDQADLEELAASIDESGLRNPVEVRAVGARYQLIQGERRLRSHKLLGKRYITAFMVSVTDEEAAVIGIVENSLGRGVFDFDTFFALRKFEGLFHNAQQIAAKAQISRTHLYRLRSFDIMSDSVLELLKAQPRLINARGAERLKQTYEHLMHEHSATKADLDKAMLAGLRGHFDGSLVIKDFSTWLMSKFVGNKAKTDGNDKTELVSDSGVALGTISKSRSAVTLKLSTKQLSQEKLTRLESFIKDLMSDEEPS